MLGCGTQRKRTSSTSGTDLSIARTALSPQSQSGTPSSTFSPRKAGDLCAKYIQQLKDLMSVRKMGALPNEKYEAERATVVQQMRKRHAQYSLSTPL